jgi:type I restriction enzyme S subunit
MAAVAEETGAIDFSMNRPVREVSKGYVRFKEGDVLSRRSLRAWRTVKLRPLSDLPTQYAAGSTEFHVFRPIAVEQRYLWYWLVSRAFRAQAQHQMSGSAGQLRVPVEFLRNATLSLPPLPEQRRIVARIDALFAEIAEGVAALAAARQGLESYRRALLKSRRHRRTDRRLARGEQARRERP